MEAHQRLARNVPGSDWYHGGGNLEWGSSDAERRQLRGKVDSVLGYGYEVRWLTRAEALRLEPDMNPAELPADEIAYFPAEGWIEPVRLIGSLLSTAGAERIWGDGVTGIDVSGGLARSSGWPRGGGCPPTPS